MKVVVSLWRNNADLRGAAAIFNRGILIHNGEFLGLAVKWQIGRKIQSIFAYKIVLNVDAVNGEVGERGALAIDGRRDCAVWAAVRYTGLQSQESKRISVQNRQAIDLCFFDCAGNFGTRGVDDFGPRLDLHRIRRRAYLEGDRRHRILSRSIKFDVVDHSGLETCSGHGNSIISVIHTLKLVAAVRPGRRTVAGIRAQVGQRHGGILDGQTLSIHDRSNNGACRRLSNNLRRAGKQQNRR